MGPRDARSKYAGTRLLTSIGHWKDEFKSIPTVYDIPILSNIEVSYTIGKLMTSALQWKHRCLRTSDVLSTGVPGTNMLKKDDSPP